MSNKYKFLKKQRYEYYKGTSEIVDNELDDFVDDVVERLNTQDFNKLELLKVKQIQDEQIAELKTKLAEMTKKYELASCPTGGLVDRLRNLEQQLAEKDEIIDWQNEIVEGVKQEEELLAQKLKSLGVDCIEDLGKTYDQDKISFAIEQLEKVKSAFCLINSKLDKVETIKEYIHYIDHQINELKEME